MLIDLGGGLVVDAEQQLREIERVDCEENLYEFLKTAWPTMDPAPWSDGWCVEAIAEHLQAVVDGEIKRLIINVPPRTSKTSLCSVAFPAWTWAQPFSSPTSGPGVKFMYASYGESLSMDHSVYCRRLIKSPWYQQHWGDRFRLMGDQDTKHKFANDKGGERQITSIDARVTGRGGQIIVIDDPNAANEAHSEAKIKSVIDWWNQTMKSRLNDAKTGAFVIIQQRIAENDLTGHIIEKNDGEWDHLMLPLCYEPKRSFVTSIGWKDPRTEEGELLWPERFDETFVNEARKDQWVFAGQYQQRPEPVGGGIVKWDWWETWEEKAFPPLDFIVASLDTAFTDKEENDPSAMTVWGVFSSDTVSVPKKSIGRNGEVVYTSTQQNELAPKVLMMYAWEERLEFHQLIKKVAETCRRFKVDRLLIEDKAAGHSVAQELRRIYGTEEFGVQLVNPGSLNKTARLHSVSHLWQEGIVYAPTTAWAEKVMTQVGQVPRAAHDDLADTCSQAMKYLRDIGVLTRAPERLQEIEDMKRHLGRPPAPLYPS